jgi:MFS family permease
MADPKPSSYRSVLVDRDFRLLMAGSTASQMGDWLYNVALLVYVFGRTHSAAWVAAATIVRLVPVVVLGPLGGVVADRFERISVMVYSALIQWAVMAGIAVGVARHAPALVVIVLAGLNTAASTATRPASLAILPPMVGESGLAPANALLHTVFDVSLVAGPALGAGILAAGGPAVAFGFNALSFLAAAITLSAISGRFPGVGAAEAPKPWAMFVDGLRAVRDTRAVPILTFLIFLGAFTYGAQTVQLIVYVQERLGEASRGYGYLLAAAGVGGVLGVTISRRLASRSRIAVAMVVSSVLFVGSQLMYAATSVTVVAIVISAVTGLAMVVADVVGETAVCRAAPGELMGRVFATTDGISVGGMVLGAVVAAPLLHATGTRTSMVILGGVAVAATLACLPVLLRLDRLTAGVVEALAPVVKLLSKLDIFTGASEQALERMATAATELRVGAGMTVIQQGEPADAFYVCTDGELEVTSTGERGRKPRVLRTLGAGSYFGEIGLVEAIPRTATVRSLTDCTLLRIDGATFLAALTEAPAGMPALARGVTNGLAATHPSVTAAHSQELLAAVGS